MKKFVLKLVSFILSVFITFVVVSILVSCRHAISDGTAQAGGILWSVISAIGHDLWAVSGHFWHQAGSNLHTLSAGAKNDIAFNPFRWFIGGPVYVLVAMCQTGVWWVSHGSTVDGVMYLIGVPLMAFLILPHMGNISLGGGGGGGGHSKGGGGGHH